MCCHSHLQIKSYAYQIIPKSYYSSSIQLFSILNSSSYMHTHLDQNLQHFMKLRQFLPIIMYSGMFFLPLINWWSCIFFFCGNAFSDDNLELSEKIYLFTPEKCRRDVIAINPSYPQPFTFQLINLSGLLATHGFQGPFSQSASISHLPALERRCINDKNHYNILNCGETYQRPNFTTVVVRLIVFNDPLILFDKQVQVFLSIQIVFKLTTLELLANWDDILKMDK